MAGRMKDIRMNALGFKRDEIRELFHQIRHIDLDAHSIEFIENKTEGWIIALRLASMIIMEKKDVEQAFKTIETDKSTISEYLVMEVLSKQPADIRKAMLISSLFDRFNENLLDNLLTEGIETNGRELINWLRKSNLFIIDLDQKGEWYRYHHLFKSILYEKLTKQTTKKDLRQMHRKASHWFENNKFLSEAMDHAIACDDVNLSTGIVKRNRLELLNGNIYYQLEQLQGRIPMSVIESDAELLLIELYIQWNHGNFPRLGELEALLDQLMDTVDKASPIHSESLFFIGFNSLFLRQDLGAAMKYFNEAMELVPESSAEPRGMLELHYFIFGQLAGLYDMLHKMYYELMDKDLLPQRKNRINQGFFAASIDQAMLSEVLKNAHDAISFADTMNMKDSRGIVEDFTGAAKLRIGEKKEALELFNNVLEDRYYVHSRIVIDSLTGIIIINCVSNNMTKADETFSILESYIENLDEFFNSMVWSVRIRYQMFLRNHETVRELLKEYKPGVLDLVLWLDVPEITHAWALIYEGSDESLEQAEKELEQLEAMCSALQNRIHLYEVKVLQAILFGLKGETENAEEALSASLEIAEPEGMYLYYVELGNMFESLIDGLSEKTRTRPFIVKVLLQIRKIQDQPAEKTPPTKKRKMNMLTQREIEVLNCISEGLRNKEIAEKLFNSEETIKKHIYNMFQKLQVKNRMNLVSKAREEGLLAE
jgi:LuxR family maltose regulon positive regulatory protein